MRVSNKYTAAITAAFISLLIIIPAFAKSPDNEKPKSVILFIGDGMAANHVKATEIYAKEILKKDLAISSIKTSGVTTTHSASSRITDSAAAATAIYTGFKVKNGQLNVLPDGAETQGIGMAAKKAGLSVGVVSSARITDATPAALYATSSSRGSHEEIAVQLMDFMPDVALGVGKRHFVPSGSNNGARKDDVDVIAQMKEKGFTYVESLNELNSVDPPNIKRLFGMFSHGDMPYAIDRKKNTSSTRLPTLAELTKAALSIVEKNTKGFLLMIEGGRIDHASHANDIRTMIDETLEFDDAISVGLKFQETHPDVLIVVTGDHETGGLKNIGDGEFSIDPAKISNLKKSLSHIEDELRKHPENQESILKSAGLDLSDEEMELLRAAQKRAQEEKSAGKAVDQKASKYDITGSLKALSAITSQRAKVEWASNNHTETPVITRATGPGAYLFEGSYDNTDIAVKISELLNLSIPRLNKKPERKTSALQCTRLAA